MGLRRRWAPTRGSEKHGRTGARLGATCNGGQEIAAIAFW